MNDKSQPLIEGRNIWKNLKIVHKNFWTKLFNWRKDNNMPWWAFWVFFPMLFAMGITFLAIIVFPVSIILTFIVRILQIADISNKWQRKPPKEIKKY